MDKITEIEERVLGKYRNSIPRVAFCGAMKKLRKAEQEYDERIERLENAFDELLEDEDRIKESLFSATLSAANSRHHDWGHPALYTVANARYEILRLLITDLGLIDEYKEYLIEESLSTAIFDPIFKEVQEHGKA